ncbi:hypothetical protein EC973_006697 [Apophysomyces ossiformis]|uniref:Uncharacterized protein n=1 Tax=Apophysomyces ossiformis TaxID=679940 RepID=A0A8H7ERG8_9FUNG|nr:hypothetical protein EC973_006697 [Apophysomyces ossiformis]
MMQHTQTHNRHKKKGSTPSRKASSAGSERRHSMSSLSKSAQEGTPSASPSSTTSSSSYYPPPSSMIHSRTLPLPSRRASFSGGAHAGSYYQHPPPSLPITSLTEENDGYPYHPTMPPYHTLAPYPPPPSHRVRTSWPPACYSPLSSSRYHYPSTGPGEHPLDSALPHPRWATPDSFGGHSIPSWRNSLSSSYTDHRRSSISTIDSGASLSSSSSSSQREAPRGGGEASFRRRLSAADLQVPIEHLQAINLGDQCAHPKEKASKREMEAGEEEARTAYPSSRWSTPEDVSNKHGVKKEEKEDEEEREEVRSPESMDKEDAERTVDITSDEYEALQGFGKFRAQSIVKSDHRDPLIGSPNIASQVYAFRQRLMPVQESFQRPTRHDMI